VLELVIVIPELYLPEAHDAPAALPGLDQIARFGAATTLEHGWRAWLASWVGRDDLALAPVSTVAAATRLQEIVGHATTWIATPLHLAAGLTTLHCDARSLLRLSPAEQNELTLDFERCFPNMRLVPLDSGEFLLLQPSTPPVVTTEPARIAGAHVADALPRGEGAAQLRRLGAEIEMWLHEHPINLARARRNERTISTLWVWGGGTGVPVARTLAHSLPRAFGADSYLQGLWRLCGGEIQSLPQQLEATYAASAALVLRGSELVELDRQFVSPAVQALRRRSVQRVSILANDRLLVLTPGGLRKFWRRPRPALESLR
jgi:hypothetical protein